VTKKQEVFDPVIYRDKRYSARAFTPNEGEAESEGGHSKLWEDSTGDWSWKPGRDKRRLGDKMTTFHGVPKGMPEQLGRARELAGEPGAVRYDS
jgi:hypothetical protein